MNHTFQYDESAIFLSYFLTMGFPLWAAMIICIWGIIGSVVMIINPEFLPCIILSKFKRTILIIISVIFNIFGFMLGLFISIVYISPYIMVESSIKSQVVIGNFLMVQTGMCVVGISTFLSGILGMGIYLLIEFILINSFLCLINSFSCFKRFLEVYKCHSILNCFSKWEYICFKKENKTSNVSKLKTDNSNLTIT